jgi:sec-independent protein translocase protein TatC
VVPPYVDLIQTTAGQAMVALIYISLFLAVILSMPVILTQLAAFISPGMYEGEKKTIMRLLIPAGILFIAGCLFSYYFITPFTINFLYTFGLALGAETFISIDSFISFVLLFIFAFGFAFQLPIIMYILTYANVVNDKFWIDNLRYAVIALLFFAAVITPDGTGITMTLVALPMVGLYLGGYAASARLNKKRDKTKRKLTKN